MLWTPISEAHPTAFKLQYTVFVVWLAMLLLPLVVEVSAFGFGLKREIRQLRREVGRQKLSSRLYWLGNDLASLRFQVMIIRPDSNGIELIRWQGNQAIEHARAAGLTGEQVSAISGLLAAYLGDPSEQNAQAFAQSLLQLQLRIGERFRAQDETTDGD